MINRRMLIENKKYNLENNTCIFHESIVFLGKEFEGNKVFWLFSQDDSGEPTLSVNPSYVTFIEVDKGEPRRVPHNVEQTME